MMFDIFLLSSVVVVAVARAAFILVSAKGAVDHYYWLLAARAYRQTRHLPAKIVGKYLLEDERQAYPPFFGWLLARLPEKLLLRPSIVVVVQIADVLVLLMLIAFAMAYNASVRDIAVVVAVYGTAPALVAYNTQLASRAFGNLFLVGAVLAAAAAVDRAQIDALALTLYAASAVMAAAVVLTHKMTVQLMLVLWPLWAFLSGDWLLLLIPLLGVVLAAFITGFDFARLLWRAHLEVILFWHRHRDELGAHLFNASPIYGNLARSEESAFHKRGLHGMLSHAARAFGHGPLVWLVPVTLLWDEAPASWIVIWSVGAAAVAFVTLYVSWLRCFGAGHLYIFNAIAPSALWWESIIRGGHRATLAVFAIGLAATMASLVYGYRLRRANLGERDESFEEALKRLELLPPGRIAVFPLVAAEAVAYRTSHAVLWGGHGLGFDKLEPIYPVMRVKVGEALNIYNCGLLLFDKRYWPAGESVVDRELPKSEIQAFGSWRLVSIPR
ncbi:MAG TPA: hypothetical protein VMV19_02660 [Xanthobacteraceae bacterium]|nr:hypothetical protein [Xanthobacteraceae bacterium]